MNLFAPKILLLSAIMLAIPASLSVAKAEHKGFMSKVAGTWKGRGYLRLKASTPKERVSCRFDGSLENGNSSFKVRLICLGIDLKMETRGRLKYDSGKHRLTGRLHTIGIGEARVTGHHTGDSMILTMQGKNPDTGKPAITTLSIIMTGNSALRSTMTASDPETSNKFQAFTAKFKR